MPLFCYMTFSSSTLFVNMQKFYRHQRLVLTFVVNIFCILCGSCIFVGFLLTLCFWICWFLVWHDPIISKHRANFFRTGNRLLFCLKHRIIICSTKYTTREIFDSAENFSRVSCRVMICTYLDYALALKQLLMILLWFFANNSLKTNFLRRNSRLKLRA